MPLWAAAAIPVAAYVVRSFLRGGDFTPDVPGDLIAYGLLVLILAAVALGRARAADEYDDELPDEVDREHGAAGDEGQDDHVLDDIE